MEKQNGEMHFKTVEEYMQYEQEQERLHNRALNDDGWREEYMKKFGDPIARYCVMGSQIFREKFNDNDTLLYKYCLEHNKTWEEVLNFKYDETVDY